MAIQNRRGSYSDFAGGANLQDGEFGIVMSGDTTTDDGTGTYISNGGGIVHRLLTDDDKTEMTSDIAALSSAMVYGGANITGGTANDTFAFWKNKGTCYSIFSMTGMLNGQPYRYGIIENIVCGDEIYQLWHTQPHGGLFFRGGHSTDTAMPSTWRQAVISSDIANMAQAFYSSWSSSFSFPCTKGGILTINGGATAFSFWWPGGTFTAVSIKGDAASAYTWNYSNGTVTVTASGNRAWTFVGN